MCATRRGDAGAALVEMVLIAPVLLLLLTGLMQAGWIGDYAIKVGNAARAGVQYGAQNLATAGDITGQKDAAENDAQNAPGVTASPSPAYCQCADGTSTTCTATACSANHRIVYVKVTATGVMPSFLNYAGLPASIRTVTIQRTAIMRVAQ